MLLKVEKKSGGRLQRGIEWGSSVKMKKNHDHVFRELNNNNNKRDLTISLEKSLDGWIGHCKSATYKFD